MTFSEVCIMYFEGLERGLSGKECVLLFQMTGVRFSCPGAPKYL